MKTETMAVGDARVEFHRRVNAAIHQDEATLITKMGVNRPVAALLPVGQGGEVRIPEGLEIYQERKRG